MTKEKIDSLEIMTKKYRRKPKTKESVLTMLTLVCFLAGKAQNKCTCGACDILDNIVEIVIDAE